MWAPLGLLLLVVGCQAVAASTAAVPTVVQELIKLRAKEKDAVIRLTTDLYKKYITVASRPFTAAIIFTSDEVATQNPTLQLDGLRGEYALAAKAVATAADNEQFFFFEARLEEVRPAFMDLQVTALPCIVRITPTQAMQKPPIELSKGDKLQPENMDMKQYPWPAELLISTLGKGSLKHSPVVRPTIYNHPFFPLIVGMGLVVTALLGYQVWQMDLLRHPAIWATLSLLVFWFSASGGMYNIIRGMPLFIRDRNGRLQFFLMNRQGQLGAEGFTMGALYILCSGSLALLTYMVPRIANGWLRGGTSWLLAGTTTVSLYYTFTLWMTKSGYKHVFYL